jgi:cytochrome bd ubiquinol oxidase subunit II
MTDLFTLPNVLAGLIVVALNGYVLLGGADFGGGIWDLLAFGPRRAPQRALIAEAIAPIWEANHVWLIIVIVLLFTCFPPAFSELATTLHIPLTIMLIGIVLRGSAFVFRHYGNGVMPVDWGRVFAIASAVTPVWLGVSLGALASGAVPRAGKTDVYAVFVAPWLTLFCFSLGALTLALFALLAAVYLTVEARERALQEDFRSRALAAQLVVLVAAVVTLGLALWSAPLVARDLTGSPWALPLYVAFSLSAAGTTAALWQRRYRLARVAAASQVSVILWGWALAQYPYLVPPTLTIPDAAAPDITLTLVLWALAGGAVVLFPSLAYLFRIFKKA